MTKGGEAMKKEIKILFCIMALATAIFSAIVVASHLSRDNYTENHIERIVAAVLYDGQPSKWYTLKELGLRFSAKSKDESVIWLVVTEEADYGFLTTDFPVFKYDQKFYQISGLHIDFPPPSPTQHELEKYEEGKWQIVGIGVLVMGWIALIIILLTSHHIFKGH